MAKVCQMYVKGIHPTNDANVQQISLHIKIMETDQEMVYIETISPSITLQTTEGIYKEPETLNAELIADALDYMSTNYNQNAFDKVYLLAGFVTVL